MVNFENLPLLVTNHQSDYFHHWIRKRPHSTINICQKFVKAVIPRPPLTNSQINHRKLPFLPVASLSSQLQLLILLKMKSSERGNSVIFWATLWHVFRQMELNYEKFCNWILNVERSSLPDAEYVHALISNRYRRQVSQRWFQSLRNRRNFRC